MLLQENSKRRAERKTFLVFFIVGGGEFLIINPSKGNMTKDFFALLIHNAPHTPRRSKAAALKGEREKVFHLKKQFSRFFFLFAATV